MIFVKKQTNLSVMIRKIFSFITFKMVSTSINLFWIETRRLTLKKTLKLFKMIQISLKRQFIKLQEQNINQTFWKFYNLSSLLDFKIQNNLLNRRRSKIIKIFTIYGTILSGNYITGKQSSLSWITVKTKMINVLSLCSLLLLVFRIKRISWGFLSKFNLMITFSQFLGVETTWFGIKYTNLKQESLLN